MSELEPLVDFEAIICRVKTMIDGGIRMELDLPETQGNILTLAHGMRGRYLRVVIYDDDKFQHALLEKV